MSTLTPGAGTANLSSAGDKDIFLAKYDASGNYLWAKGAGGTYADMANDIVVDGNGSVHITGYFYWTVDFDPGAGTANLSSAGSTDIFHAKYSASGNYESAIKLGSTNVDRGYCVSTGGNGRIYLGGSFSGTLDFDPGPGTATRMAVSYGDIFIAQYGPIAVSGAVIWEHDDVSGVNNATVNLTGSATGSDQTDNNGQFLITTGLSGGSFTLKPVKNLNKFNGVNAGDVTAIQQHVGNAVPIADNYKKVCADINKSNSITSLDASILNQALLGNPAANAIFNTSWRFVPSNHVLGNPPWGFPEQRTYTNIFTSQTGQDFIGMKIGDVTTVYANPANFGNGEPLVLLGKDRVLQAGETFTLEINAEPLNDLAAFQCAMRFDPDQLQFIDIQPLTALPLAADNFGTYNIAGGEIRLVWAQATGMAIPEAAPVFKLTFTAQQSGGKLSEVFELDESELAALAFTGALNESKVELQFSDLTATHNPAGANGVQLFQNRPNPFSGTTAIGFVLPEA
ncbi:MAG: hypothetical protein IPJ82_05295 [Lewinellaceae bacterium]|nr:hypothetical protein [Lewinellaceae bacterium]